MPSQRKPNDPNNPFRAGQVNEKGRTICGAETVLEVPCQQSAMPNGRCRRHGGMTPGGMASPHWKGGKSKYLPTALMERYEESLSDPELVALREEIALIDTRMTELMEQLEDGISPKTWTEVKALWAEVRTSRGSTQSTAAFDLFVKDDEHRLINYQRNWTQILDLTERRRKLVDTEQRRLLMSQQMLTVEQAMMMVTACISALREAVFTYADQTTARHILSESQRRYNELISIPASYRAVNGIVGETDGG